MTTTPRIAAPESPAGPTARLPAGIRLTGLLVFELFAVVVLHRLGRYPWMRIEWSDIGTWLTESPAEDVLVSVVRTLTLVLSWWLLLSTAAYTAAVLIRAPRTVRSIRWMLLPGVRRIVDSFLAVSIVGGPTLAAPAAGAPAAITIAAPDVAVEPGRAPLDDAIAFRLAIYPHDAPLGEVAANAVTYVVKPGDSLWTIAEQQLGDGDRWDEIWELNRDRLMAAGSDRPDVIHIGWELLLPSTPLPGRPADELPRTGTYVVVPGDDLWSIAENHLLQNLGRPPSPDELTTYWQSLLDTNAPRLADAGGNRIYAGQEILLPLVPGSAPATQDPPPPPSVPAPAPTAPSSPTSAPPPPPPPSTPETAPSTTAPHDDAPADPLDEPGTDSPTRLLAGIAGLTLLATALLLRLRHLRRRRAVRGTRNAPVSPPATIERGLAGVSDLPLARWAGQELARLATTIDPQRLGDAAPVAVELADDLGLEMLWNQPMHDPPAPWTVADAGWSWRLSHDPEAPVPDDELPAPVPALVTVGEREGRQLLVDLEAYGSISVVGDQTQVTDFATALVLELGAAEELTNAYVYPVDRDLPGASQLPRVTPTDPDDLVKRLTSLSNEVATALRATDLRTTFALRCGEQAPGLEAVVAIVAGTHPAAGPLIDAAQTRHGVATLVLGEGPVDPGAVITLKADGTARIDPLGVEFRATGLRQDLADQIDDLLTDAATDTDPGSEVDHVEAVRTATTGTILPAAANAEPAVLAPAGATDLVDQDQLLVRVLGAPRIPTRPNLGRRELELVVFLACKEKPVAPSTVLDALWNGKLVTGKTMWNLMARARKQLGRFDDGEPIIPDADRVHNTLRASDRVVTDLALLRRHYQEATQEPSTSAIKLLQQGLSLVEDEPFTGSGYRWAHHDDQFRQEAERLIEETTTFLIELATDAGDLSIARAAVLQGLRGLPGNEILYRARMTIEHQLGNTPGIHAAWQELTEKLTDLELDPSEATRTLYTRLTTPGNAH